MAIGITQITVFLLLILGSIYAYLKKERGFLNDWSPFLFLWLMYDQMRGIADNQDWINVKPVYDLEKFIFGWMFGGKIPNEWAQSELIQNKSITIIFAFVYAVHPLAPLILAIIIYYKSNDREMFKEYTQAFLMTCYLALITFALYPVAPPWYVEKHGFDQPEQLTGVSESVAGLADFDNYFGITAFTDFYTRFNSNPYAAVPSLHAAFSFFVAYYAIYRYRHLGKKIYLIMLYPTLVWTAAVYLNHHYIVDLLAGAAYSYFSIRVVRYARFRRKTNHNQKEIDPKDQDVDQGISPPSK